MQGSAREMTPDRLGGHDTAGTIAVRPCTAEEQDAFFWPTAVSLFGRDVPTDAAGRFFSVVDPGRLIGAFDGDRIVGSAATHSFEMSVPGGTVPTAGVAAVGVLPTHRRRGALTGMMAATLDDAERRGEPVAALWASEAAIYGRFGFGVAAFGLDVRIARRQARLLPARASGVRPWLADVDEALRVVPGLYDAARLSTPGLMSRTADWWRTRRLADGSAGGPAGDLRRVVLELDGRAAGYALYRLRRGPDEGPPVHRVELVEALGTSAVATAELWRFLLDLDLVDDVVAASLPVDHPLPWLVEDLRAVETRVVDTLWLRLVDVPAALEARAYAADDELVIAVEDDRRPRTAGRLLLRVQDGAADVRRTDRAPDLALATGDLASAYLGGVPFSQLLEAARVREGTTGAAQRADALFRWPRAPWTPEVF